VADPEEAMRRLLDLLYDHTAFKTAAYAKDDSLAEELGVTLDELRGYEQYLSAKGLIVSSGIGPSASARITAAGIDAVQQARQSRGS
jgi:hypothetical protein